MATTATSLDDDELLGLLAGFCRDRFSEALERSRNPREWDVSYAKQVRTFRELAGNLVWHRGVQSQEGYGPVGECLVTSVDSYPLVAYLDPVGGIMCGHMSCRSDSTAGVMAEMLWRVSESPNGRLGSDSRWLRKGGGTKAFLDWYSAEAVGTTLAEFARAQTPAAAPGP